MSSGQDRVFRARTARFEAAVKVEAWPDPLTAELARGLARVMDGAVRTDQPKLFFEAADRLARLPRGMVAREQHGGGGTAGAAVAGFVGAGPEVGDTED